MREPDSFKLESAAIVAKTGVVCYDYRSRNGFGGMNREHAVLSADLKTFLTNEMNGFTRAWNKWCAGQATELDAAALARNYLD